MPHAPDISTTAATLSDRVYSDLGGRARRSGREVFPLHVGDTYREPIPAARAERQRTSAHPHLHTYAPVHGEPALLDAIVARVKQRAGVTLDREDVQVVAGATSGLAIAASVMLDPGDEVLLPAPFWPLIRGVVASRGAVPVQIPFYTELSDPGFDPEAVLERAVTARTAAIYLNTPNNPTGCVLAPETIEAALRVAKRHDLWVLSDEAYEALCFATDPRPVWTYADAAGRTLVAQTVSKTYGLAGARVGYLHGPHTLMRAVRGAQTFATYCAARPMQVAVSHALRQGDVWVAESRALYADAARATAEALGVPAPEAGTFVFADVSRLLDAAPRDANDADDARDGGPDRHEDARAFLERCADAGVLLSPGGAFGTDYARWVRLCFTAVAPDALARALAVLRPLFRG